MIDIAPTLIAIPMVLFGISISFWCGAVYLIRYVGSQDLNLG